MCCRGELQHLVVGEAAVGVEVHITHALVVEVGQLLMKVACVLERCAKHHARLDMAPAAPAHRCWLGPSQHGRDLSVGVGIRLQAVAPVTVKAHHDRRRSDRVAGNRAMRHLILGSGEAAHYVECIDRIVAIGGVGNDTRLPGVMGHRTEHQAVAGAAVVEDAHLITGGPVQTVVHGSVIVGTEAVIIERHQEEARVRNGGQLDRPRHRGDDRRHRVTTQGHAVRALQFHLHQQVVAVDDDEALHHSRCAVAGGQRNVGLAIGADANLASVAPGSAHHGGAAQHHLTVEVGDDGRAAVNERGQARVQIVVDLHRTAANGRQVRLWADHEIV